MATNPQPAHQADDLTRQLKANLRRRRPRFWRITAFICLPLIIVGAFILWLAYPRTSPPRLLVIGFDALITADETPRVRARLEPQEEDRRRRAAPRSGSSTRLWDRASAARSRAPPMRTARRRRNGPCRPRPIRPRFSFAPSPTSIAPRP